MSENNTPAPAAQSAAPIPASTETTSQSTEAAPESKASESSETPAIEGSPSSDSKSIKADAAADKTGAEKVAEDKYELKVDGETLTLSKAEMIKYAQLGKAGQKRMQEAIEFQKQTKSNWEKLQQALKENPESVLEDAEIGHNKYELAKKWLAEKMENDAKSPQQLELEKALAKSAALEKQLKEIERQKEEALKQQQAEAEARETEANAKAMETEFMNAFKKYQLPNSSAMVDRMVGIMEVAQKNNLTVSVDDVAKIVRDDIKKDIQELAGMLPDEQFEDLLGEIGINKIKQSTLKKAKSAPKVDSKEVAKVVKTEEEPKQKISIKEWTKPDWAK